MTRPTGTTARVAAAAARLAAILRTVAAVLTEVAGLLDRGATALGTATTAPSSVTPGTPAPPLAAVPEPDPRDEVKEALIALGYSARDARAIVAGLPAEGTVEDLLLEALRRIAA